MTDEPGEGPPVGHREVLAYAVAGLEGQERPGQVAMADAIDGAFASGRHLLVQAGTGTGKSLGYLAPALVRLPPPPRERIARTSCTRSATRCSPTPTSPPPWPRARRGWADDRGTPS